MDVKPCLSPWGHTDSGCLRTRFWGEYLYPRQRKYLIEGQRKSHKEKLRNLCSKPNIRTIKSSRIRWIGYVARMKEMVNAYRTWKERPLSVDGRRVLKGKFRIDRDRDYAHLQSFFGHPILKKLCTYESMRGTPFASKIRRQASDSLTSHHRLIFKIREMMFPTRPRLRTTLLVTPKCN
jgi:hypothetical protein